MSIFEIANNKMAPVPQTTFAAENLLERKDIQRLVRDQIEALDDRLMVVAEEFCDWADSTRRIDLLCIDLDANLVVIEFKRGDDGSHMELQALRYAAMVSAMTFDQLVQTFAKYKNDSNPDTETARTAILNFLGWEEPDEQQFAQETRIVLAAPDFSKEITTAEAQKAEVEEEFRAPLEWLELPDVEGCCIRYVIPGGYRSPQDQWPEIDKRLVDAMVQLEKALRNRVVNLKF